ncbi:creatininase family protein [Geodermatophilus obscurus]|uniref:creatininase family protein n=1 Tax=Geodermatophilus obscurus TaxID=1861 RepID=UPI001587FFBD|nr:creatininase family protein [Geodermatophilus obscurus]
MTAPEVATRITEQSILCLPLGSYEQHGPHLPLHTDTVIAEGFTDRLIERYAERHDLWRLATLPYGLSLEHAWADGTVSLRTGLLADLLIVVVGEYVRATRSQRLLIVNGHGGNRGLLEAVLYEIEQAHRVRVCAIHPSSLSNVRVESALPEVHGGTRETSVMLALAPQDVHLDRFDGAHTVDPSQLDEIRRKILHRGATWPWSSGDAHITTAGITGGDPRLASVELGESVLASALLTAGVVLDDLASTSVADPSDARNGPPCP